jgi:hypothetical protein
MNTIRRKNQEKDGKADCRWQKYNPREEGNGDTLLGYSGRTALRREQCDMTPESCNLPICWAGLR